MTFAAFLLALFDGCKTVLPVILAVLSGLGMILTKALAGGISEIFQALALVFSGASVVGLKYRDGRARGPGAGLHGQATGTTPASGTGTARPRTAPARGQGELTARGGSPACSAGSVVRRSGGPLHRGVVHLRERPAHGTRRAGRGWNEVIGRVAKCPESNAAPGGDVARSLRGPALDLRALGLLEEDGVLNLTGCCGISWP